MILGIIIISGPKYYWILCAKYFDQLKGVHRDLSTQSCIYSVMYLFNSCYEAHECTSSQQE